MWDISKTFEFSYGHRVYTQTLNSDYSDDLKCACRHLHGHEGKVLVYLQSDKLDATGMVTDFRHLEWLKKWINKNIDHKFILCKNDPLYAKMIGDYQLDPVSIVGTHFVAGHTVRLDSITPNTPEYEYYEGFLIVDFVPTSENLSEWMGKIVDAKMCQLKVDTVRIDWWETPKSCSRWSKTNA